LDRPVMNDKHLIFDAVENGVACVAGYFDVPIGAVVALGRSDFSEDMDTWRTVVKDGLYNEWDLPVIDYFESEIRDQDFPAPGAYRDLRLYACGGAVLCSNGNHRLAGAVGWLAATKGSDTVLRKAFMEVAPVREKLIDMMVERRTAGWSVEVTQRSSDGAYFIRFAKGRKREVFSTKGDTPTQRFAPERKFFIRQPLHVNDQWETVPDIILDAWKDRDWVNTQVTDPAFEKLDR